MTQDQQCRAGYPRRTPAFVVSADMPSSPENMRPQGFGFFFGISSLF